MLSATCRPLQIIQRSKGVLSCFGIPTDLWAPCEEARTYPTFDLGAGVYWNDFVPFLRRYVPLQPTSPTPHPFSPSSLRSSSVASLQLRVVSKKKQTGSNRRADGELETGELIAGRYRVIDPLAQSTFSTTFSAMDESLERPVCLKMVNGMKESFEQSLDEVKLLVEVNAAGDPDRHRILHLYDYFYCDEHLFIVTELLMDDLYTFTRRELERGAPSFFTLAHLQAIAHQVLTALKLIHSIGLLHSDVKPENILFQSLQPCTVKLVDFGSACYTTDHLTCYAQSRHYRAPEVILGARYDSKVDVWSLGAVIAELASGRVLFDGDSVPAMLAAICATCGPLPTRLLLEGDRTAQFVTKHGAFYEYREEHLVFHLPCEARNHGDVFGYADGDYVDFVEKCLRVDPVLRPSAAELLQHPFLRRDYAREEEGSTTSHSSADTSSVVTFEPEVLKVPNDD